MENMEIVQVIRSSASEGVNVICTHLVPIDFDSPIRKEKVKQTERSFVYECEDSAPDKDSDDFQIALEDGSFECDNRDIISLVRSDID